MIGDGCIFHVVDSSKFKVDIIDAKLCKKIWKNFLFNFLKNNKQNMLKKDLEAFDNFNLETPVECDASNGKIIKFPDEISQIIERCKAQKVSIPRMFFSTIFTLIKYILICVFVFLGFLSIVKLVNSFQPEKK